MLAGHYAPALIAKRNFPEAPLWALFLACQIVDVFFFMFVILGVERMAVFPGVRGPLGMDLQYMPFTHSLSMTAVYGVAVASIGLFTGRRRVWAAVAIVLVSHWLMDLFVHLHDLPLSLASQNKVGLGLWQWPLLSLALELTLVAGSYLWWRRGQDAALIKRADLLVLALCLGQVAYALLPTLSSTLLVGLRAESFYAVFAVWAWRVEFPTGRTP